MGRHVWQGNDLFGTTTRERPSQGRGFLFYLFVGLLGLVLAAAALWFTVDRLGGSAQPLKPVTFLVVGVDTRRQDVGRTDTILLVTYNPPAQRLRAVWIPRDTRVLVPGYNYFQKVNAAYALGGVELTRRTVEELLGITIDHYLLVDFKGFVEAVDALGGVTVDVPKRMDYDDNAQDLHIHLAPGRQRLSGSEALGFVRYRSDGLGDISLVDPVNKVYEGRLARQQEFVQEIAAELLKPGNLWRLPRLIRVAFGSVETDMPLSRILAYAKAARELKVEGLSVSLLPGEGQTVGGVSYWVAADGAAAHVAQDQRAVETLPPPEKHSLVTLPDLKKGFAKVVAAVAPAPRPLPPARVSVLNGTGEPGLASRVAERLKQEGLVVAEVGNADRYGTGTTRVIDLSGRRDAVEKLKIVAPRLEIVPPGQGPAQVARTPGVDLVIVLGTDVRL